MITILLICNRIVTYQYVLVWHAFWDGTWHKTTFENVSHNILSWIPKYHSYLLISCGFRQSKELIWQYAVKPYVHLDIFRFTFQLQFDAVEMTMVPASSLIILFVEANLFLVSTIKTARVLGTVSKKISKSWGKSIWKCHAILMSSRCYLPTSRCP